MKGFNFLASSLYFLVLLQLSLSQDINTAIKENSKLKKSIKKLEIKLNKFNIYQKYKVEEKKNLEKELKLINAEYEDELERFKLFGFFTEETGLKYLKELGESLQNAQNPKQFEAIFKTQSEILESIKTNSQSHIKNIENRFSLIERLGKKSKEIYDNQVIYMLRQANYLEREDKNLENRISIFENEKKKKVFTSKTATESTNAQRFYIEPKCVNRDSCRVCLEDPNCVWCTNDKRCTIGDLNGPFDGSCVKAFKYSFCDKDCLKYSSCSECVNNHQCGWCGKLSKCIEGNSKKPIGFLCEIGYLHKESKGRCSDHYLNNKYIR